jgi:hypothetical protein
LWEGGYLCYDGIMAKDKDAPRNWTVRFADGRRMEIKKTEPSRVMRKAEHEAAIRSTRVVEIKEKR